MKKLLKIVTLFIVAVSLSLPSKATVTVGYDPLAPESNFGAPSANSDNVAYTISLSSDALNVNLNLAVDPALGGSLNGLDFTNLYFSTNVVSGTGGSTVGFEIGNADAFIPGVPGNVSTAGDGFTITHTTGNWAISIPWTYFETDPDNLRFTKISASNNVLRLNLSQSFGYSVAGGQANFGPDILGEAVLPTPEPSSWALGVIALGGLFYLRRRALRA